MSEIWYRTECFWSTPRITSVVVEKSTEKFVFFDGQRRAIESNHDCFFRTWEEAHASLMDRAQRKVASARRNLELENSYLGNVKGMRNPSKEAP